MSAPVDQSAPARGGRDAGGVIHDIGYRHYDGPRLGARYVQRSLFTESLRGSYGLGRSARSKVMPMMLLVVMCLPALIVVVVATVTRASELPLGYSAYAFEVQVVVAIFCAAQAPALMSRDLRFRVVPLYLARPLERAQYVQAKYAAMATAVFLLLALPLTMLFAGALLAEMPLGDQLPEYLRGLAGAALYAVVLAGIALLVAALTPRRGLGVAAVITVLLVLAGVQGTVRAIAGEFGQDTLAAYSGLISPFSVVDGTLSSLLGTQAAQGIEPPGMTGAIAFSAATVLLLAGCYVALLARYRKVPVS